MSAEHGHERGHEQARDRPGNGRRARRSFRLTAAALLCVLATVGAAATVAGTARGPRVLDTVLAVDQASAAAGAMVRFRFDRPVDSVDEIRTEPLAPVEVDVADRIVEVRFAEPLADGARYRVEVEVAASTGASSRADADFETPALGLLLLERDPTGPDLVKRTTASATSPEAVHRAERIQRVALAAEVVVALEADAAGALTLAFAAPGQDEPARLPLHGAATVRRLTGSPTSATVAWIESAERGANAPGRLRVLKLAGAAASAPVDVTDAAGDPLDVVDALWVPGGASLVVHLRDGGVGIVDAGSGGFTHLGVHAELRGVLPGRSAAVVADPDGTTVLDLATGAARRVDVPSAALPDGAIPGRLVPLDADGAHLVDVLLVDADRPTRVVAYVDGSGSRVLFASEPGTDVTDVCPSPNGRTAAVTAASSTGGPETTALVDIATGETLARLGGGRPSWC
ncbi:WD40 repeat domain-containing protein [Agromyces marinus]|uniref:SbsA Ig-like domain-containing protein n=1 Tax=Agromyces marinus TaxID=1389020 RepID=A0ABN6YFX3_9MICO|nr:hypothetical protein [Agromyces marinus]UIP60059.1 hypothetical protein DSM26151_29740 [Agromyces marinus]BDZ54828.1 hypothetical protein GCM10025870_19010 [Agromyces marinus]